MNTDDDFDSIFDQSSNVVKPADHDTQEPHPSATDVPADEVITDPVTDKVEATAEPEIPTIDQELTDENGKRVPLSTFLDMKDRMKQAEADAKRYREQLEESQRSVQTVASVPDPFADPHGYAAHLEAKLEQREFDNRVKLYGQLAIEKHGAEAVNAAAVWADAHSKVDPTFNGKFAAQDNPVEWLLQQHKATTSLESYQRDPIAEARRIAEEQGWLVAPATTAPATAAVSVATPQAPKPRPAASLTDAPAAIGGVSPAAITDSFNDIFDNYHKRKR